MYRTDLRKLLIDPWLLIAFSIRLIDHVPVILYVQLWTIILIILAIITHIFILDICICFYLWCVFIFRSTSCSAVWKKMFFNYVLYNTLLLWKSQCQTSNGIEFMIWQTLTVTCGLVCDLWLAHSNYRKIHKKNLDKHTTR